MFHEIAHILLQLPSIVVTFWHVHQTVAHDVWHVAHDIWTYRSDVKQAIVTAEMKMKSFVRRLRHALGVKHIGERINRLEEER